MAPAASERIIRTDELFFSTTDRRGVIRSGNSVFVRVSGFSADELIGSPHNLVRHPGMPAGVFRLMWERLLAGRPAGVYVRNRTKDGGFYWVFATVTPYADGFLSVRMAPRAALFEQVKGMYEEVADAEVGENRREAARAGQEQFELLLEKLGFGSHDAFLTEALTAEIAARGRLASGAYARPRARGPIAEVLGASAELDTALSGVVDLLERYRSFSEGLAHASTRVLAVARRLDVAVATARHASARVAGTTPILRNVAEVMATPAREATAALERLAPVLTELRALVAELRLRIAMASLHNDMIAAFAAEVVDGVAPSSSLADVPLLCDTVSESVLSTADGARRVNRALREAVVLTAEASERLEKFRAFLGQWRILTLRHRAGDALRRPVRAIDEELQAGWEGVDTLRALGEEFEATMVPLDVDALAGQVARIRAAAPLQQ